MARRRPTEKDGPSWPTPPARLVRCWVEDWIDEAFILRASTAVPSPYLNPPPPWSQHPELTAHRRHSQARREWLTESGIPREHWCSVIPATGRPSWRIPPHHRIPDKETSHDHPNA